MPEDAVISAALQLRRLVRASVLPQRGRMEGNRDKRKPGDLILDRYMPNATPEEREKAREALREVMAYLYGLPTHLPKPPSKRDSRKETGQR